MKKTAIAVLLLACALLIPSPSTAAQIKAYVAEFAVSPPDVANLKSTLQTLLSSRLASEAISPVATASEADVVVTGSFTQLGKVFSLDAVARLGSGRTLASVYEQGEGQDNLIPAVGKISAKLKAEIVKGYPKTEAVTAVTPPKTDAAPVANLPKTAAAPVATPIAEQPAQAAGHPGSTVWLSQRITGAQLALVPGLNGPEGREFLVAETNALRLYRQEKNLKLLDQVTFPLREKVIAIDSAGPDQNGSPRIYVTVMDGESPASKIFTYQGAKLKQVAGNLPYMFRAIALNGAQSKVYAQQMGIEEDFFGDLYEISENGGKIELKNPIKLPRHANVFNYNRVSGPDGKSVVTVFGADGNLIVYSEAGEELWRSSEAFGGSETYFQRQAGAILRYGENLRWRFLDQRITVTQKGEVIVPQNSGFFVLGNNRNYSKYAMVSFTWNGSSLEELWRTKKSQNYLADYYLDAKAGELVLLEVVQKDGFTGTGGTVLRTVKAQ